ncbi:cytochrome c [Aquibacillus halophilus]|uniref:Cytochrome c n=1 Tax=Aquibacillus halophilus TaxID=930132 RepID=A0A6A8DBU0_9BACI|nr:cytochrome c [Aquibacillus halophilus]MRH43098.1 cytochrome c [Aquibacillus halophilus]
MKRNPVIPYAIIAVLGILTMIVLSIVGLNQQQQIEQAAENGGEQTEEGQVMEPEEIAQSCIGCHGGDLAGGSAPGLQNVGSKYTQEEIHDIIINGIEGTAMPGGLVTGEEAEALAAWLAEKK